MINDDNNYYILRVSHQTKNKEITPCVIYSESLQQVDEMVSFTDKKTKKELLVKESRQKSLNPDLSGFRLMFLLSFFQ